MRVKRLAVLLSVLLPLALPASLKGQAQQQSSQDVLAIVDGQVLTRADLESKQAAKLLPARDQYYKAQREALDQLIDEALLEKQAQREQLTVQQLLEKHVNAKVKDPTDDQLQVYYEGLQTDQPYAVVREKSWKQNVRSASPIRGRSTSIRCEIRPILKFCWLRPASM